MKKLLILANSDSAIFKFRSELIDALTEHFEIGIGIPFGNYIDDIKNGKYQLFDIPVNRHGMNPVEDLKLMKSYEKLIKSFSPDVVLEYTIKPNLYGSMVCAKLGIPCLCNITGLGSALEHPGKLQKLLVLMYRKAMKKVNTIFFQNTYGREFFRKHKIGSEEQYYMLPGSGVNVNKFLPIEYPKDETVRYLFVARVIKEKGIDEFLYTAQKFFDEGLNAEFHICGACEEAYQDILKDLNDKGVVVYHGLVKDMRKMYAMASCVVLPSFYPEGQSNVLLEGAASARPLITTDHPGCREAVDDGKNGYLVVPRDKEDLYNKTKAFYDTDLSEKIKMGECGREKVVTQFDRNIVIEAYKERLKKLGLI